MSLCLNRIKTNTMTTIKLSRDALLDILEYIGLELDGETTADVITLCPFHDNRDSASFNVSKLHPYPFRCWNPSCGATGTLLKLVELAGHMTPMQALRFVFKYQTETSSIRDLIVRKNEEDPYEYWDESRLEGVLKNIKPAYDYMMQRGFTKETLDYFQIGYSSKKERVVIPIRDETGGLVGFSGRATDSDREPRYWDPGVPKKHVWFNENHAIGGIEVVVTEGPLDAMKVHQAGFPCVIALMGGGFSGPKQIKLTRNFPSCIIFTDNPEIDEAGLALSNKIAEAMRQAGRAVWVAKYPEGVKDPGEMSEAQIKKAIEEKESILRLRLRLGENR